MYFSRPSPNWISTCVWLPLEIKAHIIFRLQRYENTTDKLLGWICKRREGMRSFLYRLFTSKYRHYILFVVNLQTRLVLSENIPSLISPVIPKITLEYVVHPPPQKKSRLLAGYIEYLKIYFADGYKRGYPKFFSATQRQEKKFRNHTTFLQIKSSWFRLEFDIVILIYV